MATMISAPTLGTLLRRLIDHLDGAVEDAYRQAGLDYRPRYTPIVRALRAFGPSTLQTIARHMGVSHSAVSQTISQMAAQGLVRTQPGQDAREKIVHLTPKATAMLPRLERCWDATERAARTLDSDLGFSLVEVLDKTIRHLEERSFADRIRDADVGRKRARR
jgi:DNA-binding MarR family transcriptional regulator